MGLLAGISALPDRVATGEEGTRAAPASGEAQSIDTLSLLNITRYGGTLYRVELSVPGKGRVNLVLGARFVNYADLNIAAKAVDVLYSG